MRHGEDETERYSSRIQSGAEKQKMKFTEKPAIIIKAVSAGSAGMFRTVSGQNREKCRQKRGREMEYKITGYQPEKLFHFLRRSARSPEVQEMKKGSATILLNSQKTEASGFIRMRRIM